MNSLNKIALVSVVGALGAINAEAQRLPRNSFVHKPVYSVQQLIDHVKSDPVVLKHYLMHYADSDANVRTKEDLINFLRTLHTGRMPMTERMPIYRVNKHGFIDYTMQTIKAGTLAFFDPRGRVMMIKSCGNPTKYYPPPAQIKPPTMILMENAVPPTVVPEVMPGPVPIPMPMYDTEILPPLPPEFNVPPTPIVERRRSFFPIPIPFPIVHNRPCHNENVPGPAAAISFFGIAVANRLRRRRNS